MKLKIDEEISVIVNIRSCVFVYERLSDQVFIRMNLFRWEIEDIIEEMGLYAKSSDYYV